MHRLWNNGTIPPISDLRDIVTLTDITHYLHEDKNIARQCLQGLIEQYPWHVNAWHALGHIYHYLGKQEEAIEAYSHAIAIAHRYHPLIHFLHSSITYHRALLYFILGDEKAAYENIHIAIFQDHENTPARLIDKHGWTSDTSLPQYNSHVMRIAKRETELRRIELDVNRLTKSHQHHDHAINIWMQGESAQATALIASLLHTEPSIALYHLHYGLLLLEQYRYDEALTSLHDALSLHQQAHQQYHRYAALHYYHRGIVFADIGMMEIARVDWQRSADIDVTFSLPKEALVSL